MTRTVLAILAAYLVGCFPTGYLLVRAATGRDIRAVASGSTGGRNAGRVLGKWGFAVTLAGDAGKGALAAWLATRYGGGAVWLPMAALLAAVAGHVWPLPLRFRGGKGLATYVGGMLMLQPLPLAVCLLLGFALLAVLRGATRAAMLTLAISPLVLALLPTCGRANPAAAEVTLHALLVAVILFAHRANIRRAFGPRTATGRDACRPRD